MKYKLENIDNEMFLTASYKDVMKDIVIEAARQKESLLRISVKQLLKEVMQEMEQDNDQA